jgi:serine/threonine protein kinase
VVLVDLDFSICVQEKGHMFIGTPEYLSPEVVKGLNPKYFAGGVGGEQTLSYSAVGPKYFAGGAGGEQTLAYSAVSPVEQTEAYSAVSPVEQTLAYSDSDREKAEAAGKPDLLTLAYSDSDLQKTNAKAFSNLAQKMHWPMTQPG